jgi:hypothetical protein
MINRSKQDWTIGRTVKVGFLSLIVASIEPTPGDGRPDIYHLTSIDGLRRYEFTPHCGLERVK